MKKFSFRLEPVLKYKSDMLEILKNDHADSVKKVTEQNNVIERLKKEEQVSVSNFDSKKQPVLLLLRRSCMKNIL